MIVISRNEPIRYVEIFNKEVPVDVQRSLATSIFQNFLDASDHCYSTFRSAIAKDASGHYRHSSIEEGWCAIAERFPDTVKYEIKPYKNKKTGKRTGSYTELSIGAIRLTHACVRNPHSLPRETDFRNALAEEQQPGLFATEEDVPVERSGFIYGILLCGVDVSAKERSRPAFSVIRFPNKTFTAYVPETVNLFTAFPEVTNKFVSVEQEFVQDVPVNPRKHTKEKEA